MAHLSLSPPVNSGTFTPISKSYDRTTKDGVVPVINYLIGSHFNVRTGGEMAVTAVGNITNDTVKAVSGKIEIAAESVDGTTVEKQSAFVSFMYFYPGVRIVGHSELQDDAVAGPPLQRLRWIFEDLASTDQIIIDLETGVSNAVLTLRETVDTVTTILKTQQITAGDKVVQWELDFKEDGITKFHFKEASGNKTEIFKGTLNVDIAEAKVTVKNMLDQQLTKTLKSDYIWIFYPNIFIGYDSTIPNRLLGRIRVFDDNSTDTESLWDEVFSGDHKYAGEPVIENGLVRLRFNSNPGMEVFGWDVGTTAWISIGEVTPISSVGDLATTLQDVIFDSFSKVQCIVTVKYGLVNHQVSMKRGAPYVRIVANSKKFKITTTKERFALSTDVNTDIPDFNQVNSDNVNRGNPLNLSPTNNPFVFTDDTNINTGLDLLDDNWFSWYDLLANDVIGFLGVSKSPTGLTVTATSSTVLKDIEWTFDINSIVCVGILDTTPTVVSGGIPKPFNIGTIDEYVKWRANEGILGFDQRIFMRNRR